MLQLERRLAGLKCFRNAQHIGCYLANDGEIELTAVIDQIWRRHKQCYLPILDHLSANRLWFAPYTPGTPLLINRYGIPEPDVSPRHYVRAPSLDLLLAPLVAFDRHGNRLGMGGGYYDRTLHYLRHRRIWRRPTLLGVAHDFQQVARLPHESWDIPLQGIVTDREFYPAHLQRHYRGGMR